VVASPADGDLSNILGTLRVAGRGDAAAGAQAAGTVSQKFDQRGEHAFVVPDGVGSLRVRAIGEQGGYGKRQDHTLIAGGGGTAGGLGAA
jgi:hypothetical protein